MRIREKILGITLCITCLLTVSSCALLPAADATNTTTEPSDSATIEFFSMDTYMQITVFGARASEAAEAARERVLAIEQIFSRTIEDSEISQIHKAEAGTAVKVSDEAIALLERAIAASEETNGAFDITIAPVMSLWGFTKDVYHVPGEDEIASVLPLVDYKNVVIDKGAGTVTLGSAGMAIDVGGIAKGYASDEVQRVLREYACEGALISLGGNAAVMGAKPDGAAFRVAITDPMNPSAFLGVLTCQETSIVTSGGYERFFVEDGVTYIHIMDPETGRPTESDLISVTIVCTEGLRADFLSTALFVMGRERAIEFWREHKDFSMVLCDADGVIYVSEDLASSFDATEGTYAEPVIVSTEGGV